MIAHRSRMPLVVGGAVVIAIVLLAVTVTIARAWVGTYDIAIPGIPGPGALVSDGAPILRALSMIAGIVTLACAVSAMLLSPIARGGVVSPLGRRDLVLTSWAAGFWALLCLVQAAWALADVLGLPLTEALRPEVVATYWSDIPQVRTLIAVALAALFVSGLASVGSTVISAGIAALVTVLALCLPAVTGHGGGSSQHALLLASGVAHASAASIWIAAVLAVLLVSVLRREGMASAIQRLTLVTVFAIAVLAVSGIGNAAAQLNSFSELITTRYGQLVIVKVLLLGLAVAAGMGLRQWIGKKASADPASRSQLTLRLTIEIVIMALAVGIGSALTTSPSPKVLEQFPSLGESLVGYAYPPPPDFMNVVLSLRPDPVFLAICAILAGLYIGGVIRLHRRGDRWPLGRTIAWLLGVTALLWCTNAGIAGYANVAPGLHMAQHMALTMLVPIFLVLGGPATLALRALRPAKAGQWGPREWVTVALQSRAAVILTNPLVVLGIYFFGLYGLYLSSAFANLMGTHVGHVAMQTHFVLSGYLFYWILIGVDPRPRFLPYWQRFMILIIASAFHGFFAIIIMMSNGALAPEWFGVVRPEWVTDLLQETNSGGQAAWAIGEVPILIVIIAMSIQWARSDEREARRKDRQADRDDNQEMADYNAYLAHLHRRQASQTGTPTTRPERTDDWNP